MGTDVAIVCGCGAFRGTLRDVSPSVGTHAQCFCRDCRAAELHLGQPDPAPGPVDIFQTTPDRVQVDSGAEKLAVFSFGDRNLLRWYAACCDMPLFNTLRNPKLFFVGVRTNALEDTGLLGPVVGRAFLPGKNGKTRHEGLARFIWGLVSRVGRQRLTGRWKQTPFFDVTSGEPASPVTVLPRGTREALLKDAG